MNYNSVKMFLDTMCEYNTVNISQTFSAEDGHSLSVRCLPGTTTIEISNSVDQNVTQYDSVEKAAESIVTFLATYDVSMNS